MSLLVSAAILVGYVLALLACAGGSIAAGLFARRLRREMLVETSPARFGILEDRFNQWFVISVTLVAFGLVLLALAPMALHELKVW